MAFVACSDEMLASCRRLQLVLSPCCCLSCSRKNWSAVCVVAEWGAVAAAAVEAEAAAVGDFAGSAGNKRGWMLRCSQLNHNWSS